MFVLFFLWNLFINVTCDRYTGSYEYIECREEKCDVRLPILARVMDVNHLSWQGQPFTLSNDRRSMGYCFVPECNHAQVSHICQFFLPFFLSYLQEHGLLRDTEILPWQRDVKISSLFRGQFFVTCSHNLIAQEQVTFNNYKLGNY